MPFLKKGEYFALQLLLVMATHMLCASLRHASLFRSGVPRPRRAVIVAASQDKIDTIGSRTVSVEALLERDRKSVDVVDPSAFDDAPESSKPAAAGAAEVTTAPARKRKGKGKQPVAAAAAAKQDAPAKAADTKGPQKCREAIDLGLAKFNAGEYQAAIDLFQLALELPGSGVMRMAGSVREYSCPSEGEEQAALYNMACCYARLGQRGPALTCLQGLIEDASFDNFDAIRKDPDLAPVRGPELDALLAKHDSLLAKVLGKKNSKELPSSNRKWILW